MPTPQSATPPTSGSSLSGSSSREDATIYTPSVTPNGDDAVRRNAAGEGSLERDLALLSIEANQDPPNRSRTPSYSLAPSPSIGPGGTSGSACPMPRSTPTPTPSDALASLDVQLGGLALSAESRFTAPPASQTYLQPGNLSPDANISGRASPRSHRRRSSTRGSQVRHEISEEEPPADPFHDDAFQLAFLDAKRLMVRMAEELSSSSISHEAGSTLGRLHQEATHLAEFECLNTRIVGFVGDSGVGKSSLINSLLDIRGLARTSNSGAACTCVATEYHYHNRGNFVVEVEYFTYDEIREQVIELLRSYRHLYLNSGEIDAIDRKDFEERASLAQDTFRAMFGDRMQGSERFLLDSSEESALSQLMQLARETEYLSQKGLASHKRQLTDSNQCSDYLMQLTSDHKGPQGSPWPFIRKIKVYLKAHILSKGLVLVDLPGLRDLNSARREITERYILKCDEILVICYIGRASTDAGVETVVELARRAGLSNVGIICTKSDDIRADEAQRDWSGQRATAIQRMIDSIATDQQEINALRYEIDDYEGEDDLLPDEQECLRQLHIKSTRARTRKSRHEFELKSFLIRNRNQSVSEALRRLYGSRIPRADFRVFCVSNTDYWEHRDEPKDIALPYLQLSGVLEVRKHSISIVSQNQYRTATQFIKDDIPALIGSVDLWVQSGANSSSVEKKQAICNLLNELENDLRRKLVSRSSPVRSVTRSMETKFDQLVYQRRRTSQWSQGAGSTSLIWSGWHPSTYSVFCSNFGNHCTAKVGAHNWNEEAMERMISDMANYWQTLTSEIEDMRDSISRLAMASLDEAINSLDDWADTAPNPVEVLCRNLGLRQRQLLSEIEDSYNEFERELSTLRIDALSGIRTSIMGQLMESSYVACRLEGGTGSDARRKAIIRAKFSDPAIFVSLLAQLKTRFSVLAGNLGDKLQEVIANHLAALKLDLDLIRDENVVLESERDSEFRSRMEKKVKNTRESLQEIQHRIRI